MIPIRNLGASLGGLMLRPSDSVTSATYRWNTEYPFFAASWSGSGVDLRMMKGIMQERDIPSNFCYIVQFVCIYIYTCFVEGKSLTI